MSEEKQSNENQIEENMEEEEMEIEEEEETEREIGITYEVFGKYLSDAVKKITNDLRENTERDLITHWGYSSSPLWNPSINSIPFSGDALYITQRLGTKKIFFGFFERPILESLVKVTYGHEHIDGENELRVGIKYDLKKEDIKLITEGLDDALEKIQVDDYKMTRILRIETPRFNKKDLIF